MHIIYIYFHTFLDGTSTFTMPSCLPAGLKKPMFLSLRSEMFELDVGQRH